MGQAPDLHAGTEALAGHGARFSVGSVVTSGVARLQVHCLIVLVVVRGRPMMLVHGKAVAVIRMIVFGVLMDVQRRDLAGGGGQDQSEQDCNGAMH
jgi:hypothetical protein